MASRTQSASPRGIFRRMAPLYALAALLLLPPPGPAHFVGGEAFAQGAGGRGGSGLPLPRFVSLRSDKINVRRGPGRDYGVAWIYSRAGLPVEITAEFENWRRVRDVDGEEGWIFHSLLSGRRTALVAPWSGEELTDIYRRPDETSPVMARLGANVQIDVDSCEAKWCRVAIQGINGWIGQYRLWGVYPDERVD